MKPITVEWHKSGERSWVVEVAGVRLPILHRYYASEAGAQGAAEAWRKAFAASRRASEETTDDGAAGRLRQERDEALAQENTMADLLTKVPFGEHVIVSSSGTASYCATCGAVEPTSALCPVTPRSRVWASAPRLTEDDLARGYELLMLRSEGAFRLDDAAQWAVQYGLTLIREVRASRAQSEEAGRLRQALTQILAAARDTQGSDVDVINAMYTVAEAALAAGAPEGP